MSLTLCSSSFSSIKIFKKNIRETVAFVGYSIEYNIESVEYNIESVNSASTYVKNINKSVEQYKTILYPNVSQTYSPNTHN